MVRFWYKSSYWDNLGKNLNVLEFGDECKKYITNNEIKSDDLYIQRINNTIVWK